MVTSGSLKSKSLVEILEDAERQDFNGTVTLKGKTGLASITLKGGQVVDVREPRVRSRLGRYLVGKNLITEKELQAALTAQKKKGQGAFLGEVLIEQAVLDRNTLEEAMKEGAFHHLLITGGTVLTQLHNLNEIGYYCGFLEPMKEQLLQRLARPSS